MKKAFIMLTLGLFTIMIGAEEKKYDFGDMKSETLASKAWEALNSEDFDAVEVYASKCIKQYSDSAKKQQKELKALPPKETAFSYWALNDVSTCHYIKAKAYQLQNKNDEAKKECDLVIKDYCFGQCWDPQGWFWTVANACEDLKMMLGTDIDFGDYTSCTLTTKAWENLNNDPAKAMIYTKKCIDLYGEEAKKQQATLKSYAGKDNAFDYWALNDVGTCFFIQGEALCNQEKWQQAAEAYKKVVDEFFYAQCWDPQGWFWKPALASRGKINKLRAENQVKVDF